MATNGTKRAKPSFIPMSTAEWDSLSDLRQQGLISAGKWSPELPAPAIITAAPILQSSKAKAMMERIAESKEHTFALQQLWMSLEICACVPDARQFQLWFKHEFETISDAFDATAVWLSKLRNGEQPQAADEKTHADKVRYCSTVMNNMVKQERAVAVNGRFGDGSALPVGWDTFNGQQKRKLIAIHKGGNDE